MPLSQSPSPDPSASTSIGDAAYSDLDSCAPNHRPSPSDEDTIIAKLIDSEVRHMPLPDYLRRYQNRSIDITARQDSINWILKVHAYYHFHPVTALLSVNYFDRFLSSHSLPRAKGWPFQLLSVACLSLAAKMEESEVPLLLSLQLFESRFVFEPRTVQRMEILVMATLNWSLHSITPFDYLHSFISKLRSITSTQSPDSISQIYSASSDLIIGTTRVIDFLGFTPSTVAAAAVLCAAGGSPGDAEAFLYPGVNRETVRSCHQLMEEYLIDTCPSDRLKGLLIELAPEPCSPVGVLDAAPCGSCDTRSENPGLISQPEPPIKRSQSSASDVQEC